LSSNKNISINLDENLKELSCSFTDCPDIIQKQVMLKQMRKGIFIYIKDIINTDLIQRDFIRPILSMDYLIISNPSIVDYLPALNVSLCYDINAAVTSVLSGKTIFLMDGVNFAILCDSISLDKRAIMEPDAEKNVRSSHDGFIEVLSTNITLLRRKIKNNNLKFKELMLGNITNQKLYIAYIDGIANPELLNTLYNKLNEINVDGLLSMGHVEQYITDSKYSPFPQYVSTERVDKVVSALLEGQLAVLLDGTPFVVIAPVSFFSFFQAPDDYSSNWMVGTLVRFLRIIGMTIALVLPAIYISVTSFQYYLVPLNILVQLAQSRVQVAFPPIVEAILMEFTIEMLREASIRLPSYIGTTIGVVGGIIIGQASVNAGIVSSLFIIIVGITAIASYVIPSYEFGLAIILLRFIILLLSAFFGIIGVIVGIICIIIHLLALESLGQPYLMPIMPFKLNDLKDTIIRLPLQFNNKRPHLPKPVRNQRGGKN
jgi:spore germination protein